MLDPTILRKKLERVSRMSHAELRARTASLARRKLGWLVAGEGRDDAWVARSQADAASRAGLPGYLARVLASRLYGVDWTPARLADGLRAAGAADRIVAEADDLRAHRLRVLGHGVRDAGADIDWHRDLVCDARWPLRFWGLMTRGRDEGWDPKVVWEPSRHQHLLVLAAAAALTGDVAYADEVAAQLASWIAQNPTGIGIHWVESIEPALRILTWLWVLPLIADAPSFTPELCAAVLRSTIAQGRHVAANLSTYTAPNTHLMAEALALFVLGTVLPELDAARAWQEQGRAILERELVIQVGDDGLHREASLYYHAYTVEFYLIVAVLAERNGVVLAPSVRARLARMLEALVWLVRPDGVVPNVGDADGGRTLRLGAANLITVTELLASGAVLYGRPDLRAGLAPTGEEAAWLWPDGVARLSRLGWTPPLRGARHFADAHLLVERRRVDGDERYALLDAGDLGMLNGAHGHAGCLGLELFANGRATIVDRGTYVYNAALAWRCHFRGTRAHSTVVVDGVDQAESASNFQWASRYRSRVIRHETTADYTVVTAEHDAYMRLPDPVRHRRTLVSVGAEYWVVVDVLEGAAAHDVEFFFHLAPGLEATVIDDRTFAAAPDASDGLLIVPAGFVDGTSRVVVGSTDPIEGWHSDDYGQKRPAPTVITRERAALPAIRAHVIAPVTRAAQRSVTLESRHVEGGLVVIVRTPFATDRLLCGPHGAWRYADDDLEFGGEILHARAGRDGTLQRSIAVGATAFRWHGASALDALVPAERT